MVSRTPDDPPPPKRTIATAANNVHSWTAWLTEDCLGGPRPWTLSQIINFQKAGTPIYLAILIALYGNQTAPAWTYLALHGTYGVVWYIKDKTFPDARWRKRVTIAAGLNTYALALGWYWLFGWLLISRPTSPVYPLPEPIWLSLCTGLCIIGITSMIAADAQKYFSLLAKPGLITGGMFKIIRHPNYLGEMMIYASFALLVWQNLPFVVLALIWTLEFAVNMVLIETSLSRYPEWQAYRRRTWWLIPFII